MKRSLGILILVFVSSAQAQLLNVVTKIDRIDPPGRAPRILAEAISYTPKVHASVISLDLHDSSFLIPIAGNAGGSGGTYFRSDVSIANYRSVSQRIGIGWLQAGLNNANSPVQYYTVPANTTAALTDFVGVTLGKTGLGAVFVVGVDSLGNVDTNAEMDAYSRIYTQQPGSSGSVSQNFDAVTMQDSLGSLTGYIIGLKQNSAFRANVGIVNLDTSAHSWTIRSTITGASTTITVQPFSLAQVSAPAGSADAAGNVNFTLNSDGFGFYWSAYGSSTDNVTGDGYVSRAKQ